MAFSAFRFVAVAMVAALVSACQAMPPPQQQPQQASFLDQFSLGEITVDYSRLNEPMHVDDLEGDIRKSVAGGSTLQGLGMRLGVSGQVEQQRALQQAVTATMIPHVRDALSPLFRGTRPARVEVDVRSVFIRSRMSLQQLTGARVTVNGQRRPDNAQVIAGLMIFDQQTGIPLQEIRPITRIDDGSIIIAGGPAKATSSYSSSARLNQLVFEFAQGAANALARNAAGDDFQIPASEADVRTLWSSSSGN